MILAKIVEFAQWARGESRDELDCQENQEYRDEQECREGMEKYNKLALNFQLIFFRLVRSPWQARFTGHCWRSGFSGQSRR
jgi:hypothetical protein